MRAHDTPFPGRTQGTLTPLTMCPRLSPDLLVAELPEPRPTARLALGNRPEDSEVHDARRSGVPQSPCGPDPI